MKLAERSPVASTSRTESVGEEKHIWDYVRVVYKRRWIAIPALLLVFGTMTFNSMRETPIYRSQAQLLIEKDAPTVARLDQMFQSQDGWSGDSFYQTQFRILQSRTLAKRTIDSMNLWDAPRLGNGPEPKSRISPTGLVWGMVDGAVSLAKAPFRKDGPAPSTETVKPEQVEAGESAAQSARISQFLGGLSIVPDPKSKLVEVRYTSTDPQFAVAAANAVVASYIKDSLDFKVNTSKEAGDFLSERLAEQRKALDASEAALQKFKEQNGTVSIADGTSSIAVQRLTDLNGALIKARTERINKEALYNQLTSMQAAGTIETFPAVLANDYIQGLKTNLGQVQREQAQLSERYGQNHPEMTKVNSAVEAANAKLKVEIGKVVQGVNSEYRAAMAQEQSLQSALNSQRGEAIGQNRTDIAYQVLKREADSNREVYESLLNQTKETGITGERRATNVRVIDPAELPRGPISPNLRADMTFALVAGLVLAIGLAFGFEYLDNRIKSPQELKAHLGIPFLGMVPVVTLDKDPNPLMDKAALPQNFSEAFKSIRTNVLFSSAEEGTRSIVVTSAGPGEGKSVVASNLAMALAQAGQRVLLIDADMRRPRVHEIFGGDQEPGLSNVLSGNAKASEGIRKSTTAGLWLMPAGHIPPNPAELLGSRRYTDFIKSLSLHFDWVVLDTPPVMVVADSSIVANQSSGVVFVVRADHTSRHAVKAAVEQLEAANAHLIGSVLNRVDLVRNPYYYSAYYRKDYAKYYVAAGSGR
ncbi:MAG: polysaccharide biosynthesis tyrosine autokinase [Acidobacteria bacterium]|nr:polysaccharide biosynthesis tyrosine autokinase [Acidobacteriota bacterium]